MKHLKTYEDNSQEEIKVGDWVYCIDDEFAKSYVTIGKKYKVYDIDLTYQAGTQLSLFDEKGNDITKEGGGLHMKRFTKDPNHPVFIQLTANKYNI